MPDRDRDPESAAARRPARYGVPAPLLKLLERCAGIMTVTLECGQPVVDLFIDRLFLKCSIRAKSITSRRCRSGIARTRAGEARVKRIVALVIFPLGVGILVWS